MLTPAVINIVSFFYPIGNTPAVSLVQDLPRNEDAKVLLLGCGDARNILFTLANEETNAIRSFDFTCCDVEKAIIARNVLLFTLLLDDKDESHARSIWNIQYHFYLDDKDLKLLSKQSRKICKLSSSLQEWHKSEYGSILRICDQATLDSIRLVWSSYDTTKLSNNELAAFKKRFQDGHGRAMKKRGTGTVLTGVRSAGPVAMQAMADISQLDQSFWKTGTTEFGAAGKHPDFPNPTLTPSITDTFTIHYGTDPLLGFGLAAAYVPTLDRAEAPSSLQVSSNHKAVQAAKVQFLDWSRAFRAHARGKVSIRFFVGDALSFCHTLQYAPSCEISQGLSANLYRCQFQMDRLCLNGGDYGPDFAAPTKFNVVDTSNLSDHIGMLNVLVAAAPLLEKGPSATLCTEILLKRSKEHKDMKLELLCADFASVAMMLGLFPLEHWTDNTADSSVDEFIVYQMASETPRTHNRLLWKQSGSIGRLRVEANSLAEFLFRLYQKMFDVENMSTFFSRFGDPHKMTWSSMPHYHRGSFTALLRLVKDRTESDWIRTMTRLTDLIENDKAIPMSMNYIQEFYLELHLAGIYSHNVFSSAFLKVLSLNSPNRFSGWDDLPEYLCITMKVPRENLSAFTDIPQAELGTPDVHCYIRSPGNKFEARQNIFADVQLCFGQISSIGPRTSKDFQVNIIEDHAGWTGRSPLFASFKVPSYVLLIEPEDAIVAFGVRSTPLSNMNFIKVLGIEMNVYATHLNKEQEVYVTQYQPNQPGPPLFNDDTVTNLSSLSLGGESHTTVKGIFDQDSSLLRSFVGRIDYLEGAMKAHLATQSPVKAAQAAPDVFTVSIGTQHRVDIRFPVPVNGAKSATRIARKSAYVEVEVPVLETTAESRCKLALCPLYLGDGGPVAWNAPRVNLGKLSRLDIRNKAKLEWLTTHTSLMFSGYERQLREAAEKPNAPDHSNVRAHFKDGLFSLLIQSSGVQGTKANIFGISNPNGGDINILVFVAGVRLDMANHTVVLDTALVPLSHALLPQMGNFLGPLQKLPGGMCLIRVDDDEMRLWKSLLPAFVERCREWEHKDRCEYVVQGKIPLSTDEGHSPLCTCGNGTLPINQFPAALKPGAKFAVRAAISPQFASFSDDRIAAGLSGVPKSALFADESANACQACGMERTAEKPLLKCAGCKAVQYCSKECQKKAWKAHKVVCKK